MPFEFATAARILYGNGAVKHAAPAVASFGRRALVVTAADVDRSESFFKALAAEGVASEILRVTGEPTVDLVVGAVEQARQAAVEVVVGLGGGSALDTAKAAAALLANGGDPLDYLEVVGRGKALTRPSLPFIAIPTTSGTGAEVTRNAVLAVPARRVKVSLRSPLMLARLAIVDPELTYSLPPAVTASTGLDALTQLVEPYVCNQTTPLTDAVCREGLSRAARSLRRAWENGRDAAAREDMSLASLCGGLALANARLGAVHGLAGPFGGMFHAPHGAICARLLPFVMETNVRELSARQPDSPALARYDEIARIVTGDSGAAASDGITWVHRLCGDLAIAPLREYGLTDSEMPSLVKQAQASSSMKGNPLPLTDVQVQQIVREAL